MRTEWAMVESMPATADDALRLAQRHVPFHTLRVPLSRAPLEKRDDAFVPQPLHAPVPLPPEPPREPAAERPVDDGAPRRGVVISDM